MTGRLPGMRARGRGSIVVISATNGNQVALPGNAAYQAAKAALSSLVRHAAAAYGHDSVRANAVRPGGTRTQMLEEEGGLRPPPPATLPKKDFLHVLHTAGVPEDMIKAVNEQLQDPIDLERDALFLVTHGLDPDQLIDRMGGSP